MNIFSVTQIILIIIKLVGLINWNWFVVFSPALTYIIMNGILDIHDYIRTH